MMRMEAAEESGGVNHPLAPRMAAIAFVNQNLAIAGIFGSFSVLLAAVEGRLGIGRELSTLAMPALTLAAALGGPIVGTLATRYSLKLVMLVGSILGVLGFLLLAATSSFPLYIVAFGLFLGPAMSVGTVLPSALVTRWFVVNRGKALGIVCIPLVIAAVPPATTWALARYGLPTTYVLLAALASLSVIANLFIVDRPPNAAPAVATVAAPEPAAAKDGATIRQLLLNPRFWARTLAFSISASATVMLTTHIVPMGESWGFSPAQAAGLLSIQAVAGMLGTLVFGWVADRIGGVRTLILMMFNDAILFLLLTFQLGFGATAVLMFLFGMHSAGSVPVYGMALSQAFGRENFARSFGLANLINLPFAVLSVPVSALVFARTGSYSGAILGAVVLFALVFVFILLTRRDPAAAPDREAL